MIRRGFIYEVAAVFRDPKATRPVLVMSSNARNLDPRSPTIVGIPITTKLKGGIFRVRLKKGLGGVRQACEAACEQIVQVPKRNFVTDDAGTVRPLGARLDDSRCEEVVAAIVNVVSA